MIKIIVGFGEGGAGTKRVKKGATPQHNRVMGEE
jgi:hypothetical protein